MHVNEYACVCVQIGHYAAHNSETTHAYPRTYQIYIIANALKTITNAFKLQPVNIIN